uniref:Uncharacterized protein n=1 Tax=Amphimedon queenslandica TaxID=400682 RepID=A0A1X7TCV0_AMPQE
MLSLLYHSRNTATTSCLTSSLLRRDILNASSPVTLMSIIGGDPGSDAPIGCRTG